MNTINEMSPLQQRKRVGEDFSFMEMINSLNNLLGTQGTGNSGSGLGGELGGVAGGALGTMAAGPLGGFFGSKLGGILGRKLGG